MPNFHNHIPHLPTYCLRRLVVKHRHLIEKSPQLSRLFPSRPTIAFRTHKSIRKQLTRTRLEDSKIVYKIDRDLNLLCEPLPAPDEPPLIQKCKDRPSIQNHTLRAPQKIHSTTLKLKTPLAARQGMLSM